MSDEEQPKANGKDHQDRILRDLANAMFKLLHMARGIKVLEKAFESIRGELYQLRNSVDRQSSATERMHDRLFDVDKKSTTTELKLDQFRRDFEETTGKHPIEEIGAVKKRAIAAFVDGAFEQIKKHWVTWIVSALVAGASALGFSKCSAALNFFK